MEEVAISYYTNLVLVERSNVNTSTLIKTTYTSSSLTCAGNLLLIWLLDVDRGTYLGASMCVHVTYTSLKASASTEYMICNACT